MTENINILASSDDNYAQHVGVMFISLLENTKTPGNIQLYLIDNKISDKNKELLTKAVEMRGGCIEFLDPEASHYENVPAFRYGVAAYQRLSLGYYLPDSVSKVIYLDADTIVLGDIAELWSVSLDNYPLGAVENLSPKACTSLGFNRQEYFNSGMLVVDVAFWREHNVRDKALEFIKKNIQDIRFVDQCALNAVFKGRWCKLPLEWNQQGDIYGVLKKYSEGCGYSKSHIARAIKEPKVVHFIGQQKPWLWNCHSPFQYFYDGYKKISPWAGTPRPDSSFKSKLKYYTSVRKRLKQRMRYHKLSVKFASHA